jgi:uncharacterized protein (TIGR02246 family)
MKSDEQAIREIVETWHRATAAGEISRILPLMAEDAVFLGAGRPPMRGRSAFEDGLRAILAHTRIDPSGDIREIAVCGDLAYCWSDLSVKITPLAAGPTARLAGPVLTILRKRDGHWIVVRDANMLAPEPERMP